MLHQLNRAHRRRARIQLRALFEPDGMQPAPIPDLPALARRARHRAAPARRARRARRAVARFARFTRTAARHPITTGRTCVHAAKLLPTVRRAVPFYVWPILALAAAVKCLPLDFGTDETLFALAFLLIAWRRPGLLTALYREAQAGKPAPCECPRHG